MMKVIWHKQAKDALLSTALYIREQFGMKVCLDFRNEVDHIQKLLTKNPYMGAEEPLLANRAIKYRSFVISKLNKIVYYVEQDTIHIAALWNARREPQAQAKQVK